MFPRTSLARPWLIAATLLLCPLRAGAQPRSVVIEGRLLEPAAEIRSALQLPPDAEIGPELQQRIRRMLDELGYRVTITSGAGKLRLKLEPYRVVRRIYIKGNWPLFEDEILRRLRFRPGQRLPDGEDLKQAISRQEQRIRRFLAREGYFEGSIRIDVSPANRIGLVDLEVRLKKGRSYKLGDVKVRHVKPARPVHATAGTTGPSDQPKTAPAPSPSRKDEAAGRPVPMSQRDIEDLFEHRILFYRRSFTTERFKNDIEQLKRRYHALGYPGVRIQESFTVAPCRPSDRAVRIKLRIQPRRKIAVVYRGNDHVKAGTLDAVLTLFESAAYDDFELAQSASEIHRLYQSKGYLQARVRFARQHLGAQRGDRVTFDIDEGPRFRVEQVTFAGNRRIDEEQLRKVIRTKAFPWLGYIGLGEGGYITDRQLEQDAARIEQYYRERGFPRVEVRGEVAPHPALLDQPAALAAVVGEGGAETKDLFVRFRVDEGPQVLIESVQVRAASATPIGALEEATDQGPPPATRPVEIEDRAQEAPSQLRERIVASLDQQRLSYSEKELLQVLVNHPVAPGERLRLAPGQPFTVEKLKTARKALVAFYLERGYPYAEVPEPLEIPNADGTRIEIQLMVRENHRVRFGPIFVRGNFKTRKGVITDLLGFQRGDLFDVRRIRDAERSLRSLKIFNAVRIQFLGARDLPDELPVLVRVEERYDDRGAIEFGFGGSSDNLLFASVGYANNNLLGFGTSLELRGELGLEIKSGNVRYRDPRLFGSAFTLDTSGFIRQELTERLGDILTFGGTVTVGRELLPNLQAFVRYEIRRVKRQEDLYRPADSRDEGSKVDVFTTTAGVGPALVFDRRDNPLSPTRGYRLSGSALWASRYLGGSDHFLKLGADAQGYLPLPLDITIALGVRFDQGIPLGDRVLLPKVERFFAGGDTTIRGFEEDRAFAERISTPLAPYQDVLLTRVVPQGGNIRLLTNFEIQFPIWKESPLFGRDLMAAFFLDNGAVFNSYDVFRIEDFRHGIGGALRVVLPVGFASFEYAWPLDPKVGDPEDGRFHFNFGFIL